MKETDWMRIYETRPGSFSYESKFTDGVKLAAKQFKKKWASMKRQERYEFALAYKEKARFTSEDAKILNLIMQDGDEAVWTALAEFMLKHPRRDKVLKFIRGRAIEQQTPSTVYIRVLGVAKDQKSVDVLIPLCEKFRVAAQAGGGNVLHVCLSHIACCLTLLQITGSEEYERAIREYVNHPSEDIQWWAKRALGHGV